MEFSKLSSPSLKELFVREIENMILSGKLSIGYKLPPERELAADMQVSRAVVNAGLTELANKGFIEMKARIGAFVSDYHRHGTIETLLSILRYNGGSMKKAEMKSLLEIRLVLETLALELAVPQLALEDLSVLRKLAEDFGMTKEPVASAESIFHFHHELCILSGNTILPVIFYSFKELSLRFWVRYFTLYGISYLYNNTLQLYSYMENHDAKGAIATFQNSLRKTIDGVVSIYNE